MFIRINEYGTDVNVDITTFIVINAIINSVL